MGDVGDGWMMRGMNGQAGAEWKDACVGGWKAGGWKGVRDGWKDRGVDAWVN